MRTPESPEIVGMVESTSAAGCAEEDRLSKLKSKRETPPPSAPAGKPTTAPTSTKTSG